jgi:hypothetical protein
MEAGRLVVRIREALLFYLLEHLRLLQELGDPAASKTLVLANREILRPFFVSHGFGTLEETHASSSAE